MLVQSARRLPGIRFEAQAPTSLDILPRMDIAAFVGFASSGPLNVPVAVKDVRQFADIFGENAPLFFDRRSGQDVSGYLADTVRAFFRNGGTQCWVVRVAKGRLAGEKWVPAAGSDRFPIPGLVQVDQAGAFEQAELAARSEGSWADGLRVGTALSTRPIRVLVGSFEPTGDSSAEFSCTVATNAPDDIRRGDLLRLAFREHGLTLLFPVVRSRLLGPDELPPLDGSSPGGPASGLLVEVATHQPVWLPAKEAAKGGGGTAWMRKGDGRTTGVAAIVLEPDPTSPSPEMDNGSPIHLLVTAGPDLAPAIGSLLAVDLDIDGRCLVRIDEVEVGAEDGSLPLASSPPSPPGPSWSDRGLVLSGSAFWPQLTPPAAPPTFESGDLAESVSFELRVRKAEAELLIVGGLACHPGHPRYVGWLPTDAELFGDLPSVGPDAPDRTLWEVASNPRFPLAGPAPVPATDTDLDDPALEPSTRRRRYFPIGMPFLPETFLPSWKETLSEMERNGLDSFGAELFLDPALETTGTADLMKEADFVRYQSPRPRKLVGIHALLDVDEATIVSVPDAVHPGWDRDPGEAPPDAPPSDPVRRPEWWHFLPCDPPSPVSPVSQPEWWHFLDCDIRILPAPMLHEAETDLVGTVTLRWDPPSSHDQLGETEGLEPIYFVEESIDPTGWDASQVVYEGGETSVEIFGRTPGLYFYRVRAVALPPSGPSSDWSNGITVAVGLNDGWTLRMVGAAEGGAATLTEPSIAFVPEPVLEMHRALLRMCAGRADLLGVLSLPAHYREEDAVAHIARLTGREAMEPGPARPPMLSLLGEERAFGFGAVYHPWAAMARDDRPGGVKSIPPDGAAAGILAKRARIRGAWVAPANEPVVDVVNLVPLIPASSHQRLQDAQLNLFRQEPRGFLSLSADTLSGEDDLRPINVRRLLSLLRRLALLLGPTYVFEPNDEAFRRRIQRGFEAVLSRMFVLGAFAATTPDEAFRVEVSSPPNTEQTLQAGRLIVELKVAPSRPLRFLTVRLVRTGDRSLHVEGV